LSRRELDARFDEIVDFAGLAQSIDAPVKNYSSGMYVRLGFSVAINVDPDILLVDEVLAVGDEEFQRKCAEKFADLKNRQKTVVVVSHALGTMRTLCDQVALLEHGTLVTVGGAAEVVDTYLGDVHVDRALDDGSGLRWGSGEARITRLELLDKDGRSVSTVRTGDRVTFRIHYDCAQPLPRPVFGMAVHTIDGVQVTSPNTRDAGIVPETLEGSGHVDLSVDNLLLVRGVYDLSASLFDYSCMNAVDFRHRAFRFDVEQGHPNEHEGVVSLGGTWEGLRAEVF
jgi:ABC-2 type transport system ATP-binding protein